MKNDEPVTITGRAAVCVTKYTSFDLSAPDKTPIHAFSFLDPRYVDEAGTLDKSWAKDGWRLVGWAAISIQIMPTKTMLQSAVTALKAEKEAVIATAQAEATRIEGEIQKLLAITYDVEA